MVGLSDDIVAALGVSPGDNLYLVEVRSGEFTLLNDVAHQVMLGSDLMDRHSKTFSRLAKS